MLRYTIKTTSKHTALAKDLRQKQTNGEKELWKKLRAKRLHGLKFRRQVPVGPYIVDFLCKEKMLVVEVDGTSHFDDGANERDAQREEHIRKLGFDVVRFSNTACAEAPGWVAHAIALHLGLRSE